LFGDPTDVFTALDETLSSINMILGSRFITPLREKAEKWKKDIMLLGDMHDVWRDV
jgi:hypothetical protein